MIDFDKLVLSPVFSVFGQTVVYSPKDGSPFFHLVGVFDRAYLEIAMDSIGSPIATRMPILGVRESLFPFGISPQPGDRLNVAGADWTVTNPEPDGHGHVVLKLRVAS